MKLINHIYAIHQLLNQGAKSDDAPFNNRIVKHFLLTSRALILKQRAERRDYIAETNYNTFCVGLCSDTWHDCDCIPEDAACKILKTKFKIPHVVSDGTDMLLEVRTMGGTKINKVKSIQEHNGYVHSLTQKNRKSWFLQDDYIYILGTTRIKAVVIRGVFMNPEDLENINACDKEGNESDIKCFSPNQDEFPIDPDLVDPVYRVVKSHLKESLQTTKIDELNNSNAQ